MPPTNGHANGNGHKIERAEPHELIDLKHQLEKVNAERDVALAAVLALREAFCVDGGFMTMTQQRVLGDVNALLESRGLLKSKRTQWTNRT